MKPILFNTKMVQAIQEGRKTETRRVVKSTEPDWELDHIGENEAITRVRADGEAYPVNVQGLWAVFRQEGLPEFPMIKAPYQPRDILYVREAWAWLNAEDCGCMCIGPCKSYGGRYGCFIHKALNPNFTDKWRPSIHMPKDAARLFLRVSSMRVERLRDITPEGVQNEGLEWVKNPLLRYYLTTMYSESRRRFAPLWDSTVKPNKLPLYCWEANPWVWVIKFERISKETALSGDGGDV